MSNRSLAVSIAKDVLAQIKLERYQALKNYYIQIAGISMEDGSECMQTYLERAKPVCQVCAIGSTFLSYIRLKNEVTIQEAQNQSFMKRKVISIFGQTTADLMEVAFELTSHYWNEETSDSMRYLAIAWGRQFKDPTERLIKIMKNIIRNDGEFKVPRAFERNYNKKRKQWALAA